MVLDRGYMFSFFPWCFFYSSICPLISQKARRGPRASVWPYNYVSLVSHTPSVTAMALHKPIICCTSTRRRRDRNSAAAGTQMSGLVRARTPVMVLQLEWNIQQSCRSSCWQLACWTTGFSRPLCGKINCGPQESVGKPGSALEGHNIYNSAKSAESQLGQIQFRGKAVWTMEAGVEMGKQRYGSGMGNTQVRLGYDLNLSMTHMDGTTADDANQICGVNTETHHDELCSEGRPK
ncbi:hypothetical protein IRJ41_009339 [Triplophysa rosa]|uniref:Uncharacterized protein n=1 Tax=Triplophysa rosa TaxID=992332 RepID=A0A9W7WQY1_TRIRA|nr:hypothetical protein IRJ41_009339 [Triplophysa rosa]